MVARGVVVEAVEGEGEVAAVGKGSDCQEGKVAMLALGVYEEHPVLSCHHWLGHEGL